MVTRCLLLLLLSSHLWSQTIDLKSEKDSLAKIEAAQKAGDERALVSECDRLLAVHKVTALAWYMCGKYLLFVKTTDEKQALANARTAYNRLARAVADFSRTGKQTFYVLDALQYQGLAAILFRDFDRAIVHFHAALARDNRVAAAWYNLGVIYEMRGLREEATRSYDRYLRLQGTADSQDF
jgi:tetratricopeptide (TPR) repeat protein